MLNKWTRLAGRRAMFPIPHHNFAGVRDALAADFLVTRRDLPSLDYGSSRRWTAGGVDGVRYRFYLARPRVARLKAFTSLANVSRMEGVGSGEYRSAM